MQSNTLQTLVPYEHQTYNFSSNDGSPSLSKPQAPLIGVAHISLPRMPRPLAYPRKRSQGQPYHERFLSVMARLKWGFFSAS